MSLDPPLPIHWAHSLSVSCNSVVNCVTVTARRAFAPGATPPQAPDLTPPASPDRYREIFLVKAILRLRLYARSPDLGMA